VFAVEGSDSRCVGRQASGIVMLLPMAFLLCANLTFCNIRVGQAGHDVVFTDSVLHVTRCGQGCQRCMVFWVLVPSKRESLHITRNAHGLGITAGSCRSSHSQFNQMVLAWGLNHFRTADRLPAPLSQNHLAKPQLCWTSSTTLCSVQHCTDGCIEHGEIN